MDNRPRRLPNLPVDQGVLVREWRVRVSGGLKDRKPQETISDTVAGVSVRVTGEALQITGIDPH
jgi:hypothetical protein